MKIAVASDHRGFNVKDRILAQVAELQHEALDFGPSTSDICDYPDFGAKAARAVSEGEVDRAILICGSGIGMCIIANKFRGVRAALCHDDLSAEMSRRHNDANVICLSADQLSDQVADQVVRIWLKTEFDGGRHARRLQRISELEREEAERIHGS